jgi:hypothetical protein
MVQKLRFAALAALVLAAQACARKPPEASAADTAQALLTAAWSGDSPAFEKAIDRPAVRADLRRQLLAVAQVNALSVEGGASDQALDRMITPASFRLVQAESGAPLPAAPSRAQTAALLTPTGKDEACMKGAAQACVLTFAKGADGWRLVGMAPAGFTIPIAPEPPPTKS